MKIPWVVLGRIASPTFMLADRAKEKEKAKHSTNAQEQKDAVAELIKERNTCNLKWSIWIVAIIAIIDFVLIRLDWNIIDAGWMIWIIPMLVLGMLSWWAFSRACEVFWAFYRDTVEQTNSGNQEPNSSLLAWERVQLALKSYLELILDFAIIFYFLSPRMLSGLLSNIGEPGSLASLASGWLRGPDVGHILEAVYFSGITITTLGFGDLHPTGIVPRLVSVFEVMTGILLLVVCFTLYVARGDKDPAPKSQDSKPDTKEITPSGKDEGEQ